MSSLLERLLGDDTPGEQIDLESHQHDVVDVLHTAIERGLHSVGGCGVTDVAVVNEGSAGGLVVVPIARFSLDEAVMNPIWIVFGNSSVKQSLAYGPF